MAKFRHCSLSTSTTNLSWENQSRHIANDLLHESNQVELPRKKRTKKRTNNYQIHFNVYCASTEIEAVNLPDCLNELMAPPVVIIWVHSRFPWTTIPKSCAKSNELQREEKKNRPSQRTSRKCTGMELEFKTEKKILQINERKSGKISIFCAIRSCLGAFREERKIIQSCTVYVHPDLITRPREREKKVRIANE